MGYQHNSVLRLYQKMSNCVSKILRMEKPELSSDNYNTRSVLHDLQQVNLLAYLQIDTNYLRNTLYM